MNWKRIRRNCNERETGANQKRFVSRRAVDRIDYLYRSVGKKNELKLERVSLRIFPFSAASNGNRVSSTELCLSFVGLRSCYRFAAAAAAGALRWSSLTTWLIHPFVSPFVRPSIRPFVRLRVRVGPFSECSVMIYSWALALQFEAGPTGQSSDFD